MVDNNGAPTSVTLSFAGSGIWGSGSGTATPTLKLMNGYVEGADNASNTYTFSGLPMGEYDFLFYVQSDGADGRDQSIAITTGVVASGVATYFVNGNVTPSTATVFSQITATIQDGPGSSGNYIRFDDVSPDAGGNVTITGTSLNFRNSCNGIQIIGIPEPTTVAALLSGGALLLRRQRRCQVESQSR